MANDLNYEINVSVIQFSIIILTTGNPKRSPSQWLMPSYLPPCEHLRGGGDPGLKNLLEALRSEPVERNDGANDLEEKVKTGHLW